MADLPYIYRKMLQILERQGADELPVPVVYEQLTRHFRITRRDVRAILRDMERYSVVKRRKKRVVIFHR
jgi:hypothetical protein